eukprot:3505917-Rhodomonas_salina.1
MSYAARVCYVIGGAQKLSTCHTSGTDLGSVASGTDQEFAAMPGVMARTTRSACSSMISPQARSETRQKQLFLYDSLYNAVKVFDFACGSGVACYACATQCPVLTSAMSLPGQWFCRKCTGK